MKPGGLRPIQVAWRKSTYCANSECAEVAHQDGLVLLRSTLSPDDAVALTAEEFRALRLGIQAGEFDDIG